MARRDALLRLHQRLISQRDELCRMLGIELLSAQVTKNGTSDLADIANDDAERELNTQLAALESREIAKIERAILAIREGRYGNCEICQKPIPIARLNALPHTPFCVKCQRKVEAEHEASGSRDVNWEAAYDYQARQNDQELTLSDIELPD